MSGHPCGPAVTPSEVKLTGRGVSYCATCGAAFFRILKVVAVSGDGGFLMNAQELETAKRIGTAFVAVVPVDQRYGLIALNQQRRFVRTFATDFGNPDFRQYAASFGLPGFTVTAADEFLPVLRRALDFDQPAVVAVPTNSSRLPAGAP
jgi:thiamine pyrophosphate-dependent acetolactate synthase large subunit-like protein